MESKGLYAIIPAYNAAETLPAVVAGLKNAIPGIEIIVVNDGSEDETVRVIQDLDVIGVEHADNRGKGAALKSGFRVALERGADVVLTVDADGQHDPAEASRLVRALSKHEVDVVIGNRMDSTNAMPAHRVLSNRLTSLLLSWRIGQRIEDSQSGFRAIRAEVLQNVALGSERFDMESELLLKLGLRGYRVGSVAVAAIYRSDLLSSMKVADIFRFINVYLRSFFW